MACLSAGDKRRISHCIPTGRRMAALRASRAAADPDVPSPLAVTALPGTSVAVAAVRRTGRDGRWHRRALFQPSATACRSTARTSASPTTIPLLADEGRTVYKAYGMRVGSLRQIYSPEVIAKYARLIRGGMKMQHEDRRGHPPTRRRRDRRPGWPHHPRPLLEEPGRPPKCRIAGDCPSRRKE